MITDDIEALSRWSNGLINADIQYIYQQLVGGEEQTTELASRIAPLVYLRNDEISRRYVDCIHKSLHMSLFNYLVISRLVKERMPVV